MQFTKLPIPLTAIALAFATAFSLLPRAGLAQRNWEFECGTHEGYPVTMVRTGIGARTPLIYWGREMGDMTALQRCQEVSKRFEDLDKKGLLKNIKTGTVNGSPVICVTLSHDYSCSQPGARVLVTLHPEENAQEKLDMLLNTRAGASQEGSRLYLSPADERIELQVQDDGSVSVDIQDWINFRTGEGSLVFPQN